MNTMTQKSAVMVSAVPVEISSEISSALRSMCFANLTLPDCRPLEDWERKDADEFLAADFKTERSEG